MAQDGPNGMEVTKRIGRPPTTQKLPKVHFFRLPCKPNTWHPMTTLNRLRVTCTSCIREMKRMVE